MRFFQDLLVTICIVQRDGNFISFVHRSFQEYFTALFIVRSRSLDLYDVMERITFRGSLDNVGRMAIQLDEQSIMHEWVLPKLRSLELKLYLTPVCLTMNWLGTFSANSAFSAGWFPTITGKLKRVMVE